MARNKEKAQSMLHRFRDAQAVALGLAAPKDGRRPRLTSSVKSLKECEKWRSEVMKEISRKVSKIQDFGLTDYEVRDLNDEINKLLREKGHWERQIVDLGGANYRRGVPRMMDDSGREVPGTRGYKYFGRAKDLPGVKELLTRTVAQEEEAESFRAQKYKRFANQPPAYYGDADEDDDILLRDEVAFEESAWRTGYAALLEELGEEDPAEGSGSIPPIPRPPPLSLKAMREEAQRAAKAVPEGAPSAPKAMLEPPAAATAKGKGKRAAQTKAGKGKKKKAEDGSAVDAAAPDEDAEMQDADADAMQGVESTSAHAAPEPAGDKESVSALFSVLDPAELRSPAVPDRQETEAFILQARKKALKEQYIG